MKTTKNSYESGKLYYLIFFIIILSVVIASGLIYYSNEKEEYENEVKNVLSAIAHLKQNQIEEWRKERINDAYTFSDNLNFITSVNDWFPNPDNNELKLRLKSRLASLNHYENYLDVFLVDNNNNLKLTANETEGPLSNVTLELYKKAINEKNVIFSDFYFCDEHKCVYLDIFAPLFYQNSYIGGLIIRINPEKYLYPLIQSFPIPNETGENVLFKIENNEIVYLNELRHRKNTALNFKIPISEENKNILSVHAAKGVLDITEGIDYRGKNVIGHISKIKNSNWYLVTKIDYDEIFQSVYERTVFIFLFLAIIVILIGISFLWFYKNRKKTLEIYRLQLELERKALQTHYDEAFRNANDIIILFSVDGKVMEVNKKAIDVYGYSEEELKKLHAYDFRIPEERKMAKQLFKDVLLKGTIRFESKHIKKSGEIFPVEVSASVIQVENVKCIQSIVRDITEMKLAEEKFKILALKNEAILSSVSDIIMQVDNNKVYTWANKAGYDFFGDDVIGNEASYYFLGEQDTYKKVESLFEGEEDIIYVESLQKRKDGEARLLAWWCKVLKDTSGNVIGAISTARDITEKNKAERRNLQLTRTYSVLYHVNQIIAKTKDINSVFKEVCNIIVKYDNLKLVWINLFDESDNNKIDTVAYAGIHDGLLDIEEIRNFQGCDEFKNILTLIRENKSFFCNDFKTDFGDCNFENEFSLRGFKSLALLPVSPDNIAVGFVVLLSEEENFFDEDEKNLYQEVLMNVSFSIESIHLEKEKNRALESLTQSEKKFKIIFESASDAIILVSKQNYSIMDCNDMAVEMSGYNKEELLNRNILEFFEEKQKDGSDTAVLVKNYIENTPKGKTTIVILDIILKNGRKITAEISFGVIRIGSEDVIIAIIRDITEYYEYQEELKRAKLEAEKMNKMKTNFLANISHELRTPMVGILGFSKILFELENETELKDYADMINKSGERLMNTLNLLLDMVDIEENTLSVNYSFFDIIGEIKDVLKDFESSAAMKELFLKTDFDSNQITVNLDKKIFRQIMKNFIGNAIKFTYKGGVTISVSKILKDNKNCISIKVIDTGVGIPEDKKDIIWEEFRQASEGLNRSFQGIGLGLPVTKKLVEKINGSVVLENSELNKGSVFTIILPIVGDESDITPSQEKIVSSDKPLSPVPKVESGQKPCVLYVEDDKVTVALVKKYLSEICSIETAANGEEAINKVKSANYPAILLDINLGEGMSGIEALQIIRKISGYENIPVVAVTAFSAVGDKEEFLSRGCTHYLSKPFKAVDLQKLVKEILVEK